MDVGAVLKDLVEMAVKKAVLEEREACAKAAQRHDAKEYEYTASIDAHGNYMAGRQHEAKDIEARIRARGKS